MSKMPLVDIEENIKQISAQMNGLREELLRLEGVLRTFQGFKEGGLSIIELPRHPAENKELDSIQEKPQ